MREWLNIRDGSASLLSKIVDVLIGLDFAGDSSSGDDQPAIMKAWTIASFLFLIIDSEYTFTLEK